MSSPSNERLLLLGCGILKKEICHLIAVNNWPLDTFFLDSILHVDFSALETALKSALARYSARTVLVYYGACHPRMDKMLADAGVTRTPGQNCVEMLLGEELFTRELSSGAYFLLEEWAVRWDYMIHKTFGTNDAITRAIFHEDRSSILCLRTPCSDDFSCQAEAAGIQIGLPVRWQDITLDNLQKCLSASIAAVERGTP